MAISGGDFDRIRSVLASADPEEPMTARAIRDLLAEHGLEYDSAHQVATVLGRRAESGDVEVIREQPYRYRLREDR